jgi:hypothetical protein
MLAGQRSGLTTFEEGELSKIRVGSINPTHSVLAQNRRNMGVRNQITSDEHGFCHCQIVVSEACFFNDDPGAGKGKKTLNVLPGSRWIEWC